MATSGQNFANFRSSVNQQEDSYREKVDGVKKIEIETQKNVEERIRSILSSKDKAADIQDTKLQAGPSNEGEQGDSHLETNSMNA